MAASTKQRLSAMLDADLEKDGLMPSQAMEVEIESNDAGRARPTTISEWLQVATPAEMRACLKALATEQGDVGKQVRELLEEDRAHQSWVDRQEKEWKKAPQEAQTPQEKQEAQPQCERDDDDEMTAEVRYIPLRLTPEERSLLGILEGALYVSEYTDQVDVYHVGNKSRRMALQIQQVCAILAGLVVANNFDVARKPLMERNFAENQQFFRSVFEIGRRYKILSPEKFRGTYGKLIHMLQDSVKAEVVRQIGFECNAPVRTVWSLLKNKHNGAALMKDPLLVTATREIYTESKSRAEILSETREKSDALIALKKKYGEPLPDGIEKTKPAGDLAELLKASKNRAPDSSNIMVLTEDAIEMVVASISDHFAFQRFNREPVVRMIEYLKRYFDPTKERDWSLEICRNKAGSCLSHGHRTQYTFVLQSMLLWREIMGNMFQLWQMTEEDLLDSDSSYRLCDTGQGLNRMQQAPRVSRAMHQILHKVQSEVGNWVGLSVVHLGDRDVPNALIFIDKYTQVPRILAPIVRALDRLPEVYTSTQAIKDYIDSEFNGLEVLRMTILQDFFRHGFDGSGDDGGSCVDGRLTSCWNWCSKIEKKKYFPAFLLTGFTGFDGGFETGLGS